MLVDTELVKEAMQFEGIIPATVDAVLLYLTMLNNTNTEQPVGCPRSVVLSLKAAMALTKKYLFLVGERKIGDKEITELREAHYQVGNAFDELQRITNRETQREPQEILDEASSIYETWLTDGGFESVRALVNRAYEAGRAPEREFSWVEAARMANDDADNLDKNNPPLTASACLRLLAMKFKAKTNESDDQPRRG